MSLGNRIMRLEEHGTAVGDHIFQHPYNEASEEEKDKLLDEAFLKLESAYKALDMRRNIRRALDMNPSQDELRIAQSMLNQQPAWLQASSMRFESRNPSIENLRMRMESEDNIFQRFWKWIKEFFSSLFGGEKGGGGGISSTVATATDNVAASQQFVAAQKAEGKQRIYIESTAGVGKDFRDIFDFPDFKKSFEWLDSVGHQIKAMAETNISFFTDLKNNKFEVPMKLESEDEETWFKKLEVFFIDHYIEKIQAINTPYSLKLRDEALSAAKSKVEFTEPNKVIVTAIRPFKVEVFGKVNSDSKHMDGVEVEITGGRKEFEPIYIDFNDWIGFATKLAAVSKSFEESSKRLSKVFSENPDTFFDGLIAEEEKNTGGEGETSSNTAPKRASRLLGLKIVKVIIGNLVKELRKITAELSGLATQMAAINAVEESSKADNQEKADKEKKLVQEVSAKNLFTTKNTEGKEETDKDLRSLFNVYDTADVNKELLHIAKTLGIGRVNKIFNDAKSVVEKRKNSDDKTKPSDADIRGGLRKAIDEAKEEADKKAKES